MPVQATRRIDKQSYEIESGPHKITADVSLSLGGQNQGPSPHELLEAALAACTAITLQMYANRKGMHLDSANVKVEILQEGTENLMQREIQLLGNLSDDQKSRLLEIADKCPVHLLLTRGTKIESRLA